MGSQISYLGLFQLLLFSSSLIGPSVPLVPYLPPLDGGGPAFLRAELQPRNLMASSQTTAPSASVGSIAAKEQ